MKQILVGVFILYVLYYKAQVVNTTLTYSVNFPATKTAKPPVLIMLHGYGSNEADLFNLAKQLDSRFITFSLRAPRTTKNGGFCWYELTFLNNGQFNYNYNEAMDSRTKILSFISNACKTFQVDSTQVYLIGFSQGAIMAYDIAITSPKKIKGVLALSGRMMAETKEQKTDWLQVAKVNFFIAHGDFNSVIKIDEAKKASNFLMQKNVTKVEYKNYPIQHSINDKELMDIKNWLVKTMNGSGN